MAMQWNSLPALIATGGSVMVVLAALSVVALAIVLDKLWGFWRAGIWRRREAEGALEQWRLGRRGAALQRLEGGVDPVSDVLRVAFNGRDERVAREEIARRGAAWLESLRGGLRPLELIGTLAPLLGLLGTVLGMIEAFRALEAAGGQVNPSVLSGGIWAALLTTAAGLVIAIPAVAAHTLFERQLERLHHRMQDAATRVFCSVERNPESPTAAGDAATTIQPVTVRAAEAAGAD